MGPILSIFYIFWYKLNYGKSRKGFEDWSIVASDISLLKDVYIDWEEIMGINKIADCAIKIRQDNPQKQNHSKGITGWYLTG